MKPSPVAEGTGQRLQFLDAIRAIAALFVVLQHTLEQVSPTFVYFCQNYFTFGRVGVIAFFLVSGFIIPVSLERTKSLKRFWISRVFRLYPLYWVSVTGAALIIFAAFRHTDHFVLRFWAIQFAANLTMFQTVLREPNLLDLYGTLFYEMLFYLGMSLLFFVKANQRTVPIFWALIGVAALSLLPGFPQQKAVFLVAFWASCFLFGTLLYRYSSGAVSGKTLLITTTVFFAVMAPGHALILIRSHEDLCIMTSWIVGYGLFIGLFLARRCQFPKWLLSIGRVSYSIYLLHGLILLLSVWLGKVNGAILTLLLVLPLAYLSFNLIEQRFVDVGRSLTRPKPVKLAA